MDERSIAEEITGDWLRVAQAWKFGVLEDLAIAAHEKAKEGYWKTEAEAVLVGDIAEAPGKGEGWPDLTPEQDEKLRRLIKRADAFVNARTALEDHATGKVRDESLRQTLAVLGVERERAEAEVQRTRQK